MLRDFFQPADWCRKVRPNGPRARLLIVEPDRDVAHLLRHIFQWHGFGAPETVADGEEALDTLGAMAQRVDLVMMALTPPAGTDTDMVGVLRQVRSPVRLACYGAATHDEVSHAHRLVGIAAYFDLSSLYGIVRQAQEVLASVWTVRRVLASSLVPQTMSPVWAAAVYGAAPGHAFARTRAHPDHPSHL
ncbi:MAG: response regulator transcription factor [Hyphomicrobiaceae bacterium]|nr:MAG: response regulator transcription factor [Hyphomicrobiaceae bacterium]